MTASNTLRQINICHLSSLTMSMTQLYNHCFFSDEITEGACFPIGGGFIGTKDAPFKVRADYQNIFPRLAEITDKYSAHYQADAWQNWFRNISPDTDLALTTTLHAFTAAFEQERKQQKNAQQERMALYNQAPNNTVNLSEVFSSKNAMCAEIALLAKRYLDIKNIKSFIYSGEILTRLNPNGAHEAEPHTFLIVEHQKIEYVFDPANPNIMQEGRDLFSLSKTYRSLVRGDDLRSNSLFVETKDVVSQNVRFYGVGDCGDVPERYLVRERSPNQPSPFSFPMNSVSKPK